MEYIPSLELCSEDQIANLRKLLDYLKSSTDRLTEFDMGSFSTKKATTAPFSKRKNHLEPEEVKNECGTVCCLAGHGPLAGVPVLPNEGWHAFVSRAFVTEPTVKGGSGAAFNFLFSSYWSHCQPTLDQALFRLELFLNKGLPRSWSESCVAIDDVGIVDYPCVPILYGRFAADCQQGLHTLN